MSSAQTHQPVVLQIPYTSSMYGFRKKKIGAIGGRFLLNTQNLILRLL